MTIDRNLSPDRLEVEPPLDRWRSNVNLSATRRKPTFHLPAFRSMWTGIQRSLDLIQELEEERRLSIDYIVRWRFDLEIAAELNPPFPSDSLVVFPSSWFTQTLAISDCAFMGPRDLMFKFVRGMQDPEEMIQTLLEKDLDYDLSPEEILTYSLRQSSIPFRYGVAPLTLIRPSGDRSEVSGGPNFFSYLVVPLGCKPGKSESLKMKFLDDDPDLEDARHLTPHPLGDAYTCAPKECWSLRPLHFRRIYRWIEREQTIPQLVAVHSRYLRYLLVKKMFGRFFLTLIVLNPFRVVYRTIYRKLEARNLVRIGRDSFADIQIFDARGGHN